MWEATARPADGGTTSNQRNFLSSAAIPWLTSKAKSSSSLAKKGRTPTRNPPCGGDADRRAETVLGFDCLCPTGGILIIRLRNAYALYSPPATQPLSLGNPCQPQASHVSLAIACLFNRINLSESLDGKVSFKRQEFVDIRSGVREPTEMTKRGDKRLVAVDKLRIHHHKPLSDLHHLFVIAFEHVGDGIEILEPGIVRIEWSQIAIALQTRQRFIRIADITIRRRAQRPNERQIGIQPQCTVKKMNGIIKIPVEERANVTVD